METGSCRPSVNTGVDGNHFSVVGVNSVIDTCDVSVAEHVQNTAFLDDTGREATDVGSVQREGRVAVITKDTVGGSSVGTHEDGPCVGNVTVFDHHGVVG